MGLLFPAFVEIRVEFRPRRREPVDVEMDEGGTVSDLLQVVEEPAVSTVAVVDGSPVSESTLLVDGQRVLLLSALSGG